MATLADKRSNYLRRAAHQLSVPRANLNCLFAATIVTAWKVESWPRITRTKQGEKNEGDSDFNSCTQFTNLPRLILKQTRSRSSLVAIRLFSSLSLSLCPHFLFVESTNLWNNLYRSLVERSLAGRVLPSISPTSDALSEMLTPAYR